MPDILLEKGSEMRAVRNCHDCATDRPRPEWVRGECPLGGESLVSCYYIGGRGYLVVWTCWASLAPNALCNYKKVL